MNILIEIGIMLNLELLGLSYKSNFIIMRLILLSIFFAVTLVACQNKNTKSGEIIEEAMQEGMAEPELIGADVDSHGCKRSAGFTWSQLRGDCIKIFEEGMTLLPVDLKESEPVYAAFVLYSEDKSEIELFLPSEKESIVLQKTKENSYEKDAFRFDDNIKILYINGEVEFEEDRG